MSHFLSLTPPSSRASLPSLPVPALRIDPSLWPARNLHWPSRLSPTRPPNVRTRARTVSKIDIRCHGLSTPTGSNAGMESGLRRDPRDQHGGSRRPIDCVQHDSMEPITSDQWPSVRPWTRTRRPSSCVTASVVTRGMKWLRYDKPRSRMMDGVRKSYGPSCP